EGGAERRRDTGTRRHGDAEARRRGDAGHGDTGTRRHGVPPSRGPTVSFRAARGCYTAFFTMQECYHAGLQWLAHSGIQAASGGLSRYYRGDTEEYKNISTEITSYAIQAYLQLPLPGEPGLLSHALRAGQFLC